ncbi:hypothetical protein LTR17_002550 [Elasticomyces elasticus]|nr:hypothetical protein LTR17_002550 [Elasticomyces elasticus]
MLPTQVKEGIAVEVTYWDDRSELEDVVLGTTFATLILLRDFDMRSAPGIAIVITCNTEGKLLESNEHTDYYWLKAEDVCEFLDVKELDYLKGRRTERSRGEDWFLEPGDVSWCNRGPQGPVFNKLHEKLYKQHAALLTYMRNASAKEAVLAKAQLRSQRRQHKKLRGKTGEDIWLERQLACEDQDDEEMLPVKREPELAASVADGDGLQAGSRRTLLASKQPNEQALLRDSTALGLQGNGVKTEAGDDDPGAATVPVDTAEPGDKARVEQTPVSTTGAASSPRLSDDVSELVDRLDETRLKLETTRLKQDETRLKQEEIGLKLEAMQLRGRLRALNERT